MVASDANVSYPTSPLTSRQQDRLHQVLKYLTTVSDGKLGAKVALFGYDGDEHRTGWALWTKAAGVERPFEHVLAGSTYRDLLDGPSASAQRFSVLDGFENRWMPRSRNAIRRFVDPEHREAFEEAFFENLSQQPEGPAVVSSVTLLVARLDEMSRSNVPGARAAWEALVKKGLTEIVVAHIRGVLDDCRAAAEPLPEPTVDPTEVQAAAREQLAAFEELNAWYIDWAVTLRAELSYRDCVRLGIVTPRRNHTAPTSTSDEE